MVRAEVEGAAGAPSKEEAAGPSCGVAGFWSDWSGTISAKSRIVPAAGSRDSAVNLAINRPAGDWENSFTGSKSSEPSNAVGNG